jgi:zinc/manganese transport system substrate-binding protein
MSALFEPLLSRRSAASRPLAWLLAVLAALATAACGLSGTSGGGTRLEVVAAENFWGSIGSQVGGFHVHVTSIIANPDADPHTYEPTPGDAKLIARARYVIANGVGYDPWTSRLVDANPSRSRRQLIVGDLVGKKEGDNPHLWYSPAYVDRAVDRMTADFKILDPPDASYFDQQGGQFKELGLKDYHDTVRAIRQKYGGTPVGASESIFQYMTQAAGLNLITPYGFLKAVSEGTGVSPADRAAVQQQITSRQIKAFVFNTQNSTPDVQSLVATARAEGIPTPTITETLSPANLSFQDWQTNQLRELLLALGG